MDSRSKYDQHRETWWFFCFGIRCALYIFPKIIDDDHDHEDEQVAEAEDDHDDEDDDEAEDDHDEHGDVDIAKGGLTQLLVQRFHQST